MNEFLKNTSTLIGEFFESLDELATSSERKEGFEILKKNVEHSKQQMHNTNKTSVNKVTSSNRMPSTTKKNGIIVKKVHTIDMMQSHVINSDNNNHGEKNKKIISRLGLLFFIVIVISMLVNTFVLNEENREKVVNSFKETFNIDE